MGTQDWREESQYESGGQLGGGGAEGDGYGVGDMVGGGASGDGGGADDAEEDAGADDSEGGGAVELSCAMASGEARIVNVTRHPMKLRCAAIWDPRALPTCGEPMAGGRTVFDAQAQDL